MSTWPVTISLSGRAFDHPTGSRWWRAMIPLDAAWSMQHIAASVATWRRDVGVGENMMARRTTLAAYLVLSSFLLACAGRHPTPEALAPSDTETAAPEPVDLAVEYHNSGDVLLYVVHDRGQTRLTQ